MKRAGLALVVCLLLASVGCAQQNPADAPASKEDVEKYMTAAHRRELVLSTMAAAKKQMHELALDQVKKDPRLPSDFVAHMDSTFGEVFKNFPVDEVLEAEIPVYQKHFTRGDIDALIAFYSTPTGRKYLREMPAVQAEVMQATVPVVQKMMAQARERLQQEVAQAQKAGDPGSPKKPQQN